jgi:hypothetical protein
VADKTNQKLGSLSIVTQQSFDLIRNQVTSTGKRMSGMDKTILLPFNNNKVGELTSLRTVANETDKKLDSQQNQFTIIQQSLDLIQKQITSTGT